MSASRVTPASAGLSLLNLQDLHGASGGVSPRGATPRGSASPPPSSRNREARSLHGDKDLDSVPDIPMPTNLQALMDGQQRLERQAQELVASVAGANVLVQGQVRLARQLEALRLQINGGGLHQRVACASDASLACASDASDAQSVLADMKGDVEDGIYKGSECSQRSKPDPTGDGEDGGVDFASEAEERRGAVRRALRLISLRRDRTTASEVLHGHTGLHFAAWMAEVITCIAFTLACGVMLALWGRHVNEEAFVNTFFVTAIAAMTYFAKACHMGDLMFRGQVVPIARYIDWITTTPLMLYEVCHIAHAPASMTIMVIVCDLLMLATGVISAAVPWKPYKAMKKVWFLFSCLFYVLMVIVLQADVAYKASKQVEVAATLFKRLEVLTVVVWSFYPVVVMTGRAHLGLITKPTEDILLCVLDVVAKIGMEGLIVASCFNGCVGDYDSH